MFKFLTRGRTTTPTTQEAIQKLCDAEDVLNKKLDFLEKKRNEQILIAKNSATLDKKRP